MNRFLILIALLWSFQAFDANAQNEFVQLDVMTAAVSEQSLEKIPVKVSIPNGFRSTSIEFELMEQKSGEVLFTGTPYDSVRVQIPSNQTITNQFGDHASLQDLKLMYGDTNNISAMDVLSPVGCTTLTIPKTGRLYIRLGAKITADEPLEGIYTARLRMNCESDRR